MELSVVTVSAGGNPTALIERPAVPAELRPVIGAYVLGNHIVQAEQVGFLGEPESADVRLDMAGDELCINALRSAATLAFADKPDQPIWSIATSGFSRPVQCRVARRDGQYDCSIELPIDAEAAEVGDDLRLTVLDTIAHFTLRVDAIPDSRTIDALTAEAWERPEVRRLPAVGFIPFTQHEDQLAIAPLIYTRSINVTVRETACGSGSIAAALHALSHDQSEVFITQPSGSVYRVALGSRDGARVATLGSEMTIGTRRSITVPSSLLG
jgi:histidine racemase